MHSGIHQRTEQRKLIACSAPGIIGAGF